MALMRNTILQFAQKFRSNPRTNKMMSVAEVRDEEGSEVALNKEELTFLLKEMNAEDEPFNKMLVRVQLAVRDDTEGRYLDFLPLSQSDRNLILEVRFKSITKLTHTELEEFMKWIFEEVRLGVRLEIKPSHAENLEQWLSKMKQVILKAHVPSLYALSFHKNFEIPKKEVVNAYTRIHNELQAMIKNAGRMVLALVEDGRTEYPSLAQLAEAALLRPDASF
jgi:hypothetical protein